MMSAHLLQIFKWCLERKPFTDAQRKLALFFHFFKDQEILPVAEVLHAGDAMLQSIRNGQFIALTTLVMSRRWDDLVDQVLGRLAQNSRRVSIAIQIDGAALRSLCLTGDSGCRQRGRVGNRNMSIDAIEKSRMSSRDFVEILARRQNLLRPQRVIPIATRKPMTPGRRICKCLDAGEHIGERLHAGEIDIEFGLASAAQMRVSVVESRKDNGARLR